jgi:hypothetical protein
MRFPCVGCLKRLYYISLNGPDTVHRHQVFLSRRWRAESRQSPAPRRNGPEWVVGAPLNPRGNQRGKAKEPLPLTSHREKKEKQPKIEYAHKMLRQIVKTRNRAMYLEDCPISPEIVIRRPRPVTAKRIPCIITLEFDDSNTYDIPPPIQVIKTRLTTHRQNSSAKFSIYRKNCKRPLLHTPSHIILLHPG